MLETPQRKEQPWLQHGCMAGETVAELAAEVTDAHVGETKRRRNLNFFVGRKSSVFNSAVVANSYSNQSAHDEEVKDYRYVCRISRAT